MERENKIFAIVTTDKNLIPHSGAPVILAQDEEELQTLTEELDRIIMGRSFRLSNGIVFITY